MNDNLQPEFDAPINVAVCIPTCGTVEPATAICIAAMAGVSLLHRIRVYLINQDLSGIARNRNSLVQQAMDSGAEYLLFIDSDMTFPADMLARLIKREKSIVGVPYPRRAKPFGLLGMPVDPANSQSGCVPFVFLPAGLMLIKIDVLAEMRWPWFFEHYEYQGDKPADQFFYAVQDLYGKALPQDIFAAIMDHCQDFKSEDVSEDVNFCRKARRCGHEIYADLDLLREVGHIGTQVVRVSGAPDAPEAAE
jgi:glycosyltransferase involved in cell wall biosynthesis